MVGNWFGLAGRVDCNLLAVIGQAGVADGVGLVLEDVPNVASLARRCSPKDELETNRLNAFSGGVELLGQVESLGQAGLPGATLGPEPGPGAAVESAASLVCSCCQTATVESWKAIAKPPRIPAITT